MKKFLPEQNLIQTFMMGLLIIAFLLTVKKGEAQIADSNSLKSANIENAVSQPDSLILVNLYNSCDGPKWKNNANWLTGPLNTWYGITIVADKITEIKLRENNLKGTIPPGLGQIISLNVLDLDTNQLSGSIPIELAQLTNLTALHLSGNQLTGAIPVGLGQLTNLTELYLNNNNLSGSIPAELGQLTNLKYLNLNRNILTGSIPTELAQMTNLVLLYLEGNQLTGSIPVELSQLTKMLWFNLGRNQLTGAIPVEFAQLSDLEYFNLADNQLTGSFPDFLKQLTKLKWVNLGNNLLSGTIPSDVWLQPDLAMLYINGNQISGSIPVELGQLTKMKWLNLGQNQLTGVIPTELGQLDSLALLFLNGNQLTGTIPSELGQNSNLKWINLNNNQLTGKIPAEIWNLTKLSQLYLGNNNLIDTIPLELGQLTDLEWIDLNSNKFTGSIPSEISQLNRLKYFNIELNQLDSLPKLTPPDSLQALYVSNNKLTFEDLEYNMDLKSPSLIFSFTPQDSIGENISDTKYRGESFSYHLVTGGSHNSYKWFKDGKVLDAQTSATLDLNNLRRGNTGKYYCEVSNSVVTDLKLRSKTINLEVIDTTETCIKLKFIAGWNILSAPVIPDSADMKAVFQSLIDHNSLIKIQDESGNSLENWGFFGGWQNNIGDINPTEGYRIKMSKPDSLEICGKNVDFPFEIPLQSGWNIIGYPQLDAIDGMDVVQQLIDRNTLKKVQDETGNSIENWGFFGGWQNNIGNFVTGKGYKVKVNLKDTLTVSESYPKSAAIELNHNMTIHFKPIWQGNGNDHMNINLVNLPVNAMQEGDEIAVFDGTACVGSISILPGHLKNKSVSIIASAADDDEIFGFISGNPFKLKLWNSKQNREILIEPEIFEGSSTFVKNETTLASLEKSALTGLYDFADQNLFQSKCYPNPFSDEVNIEILLANDANVNVDIINQLGQRIQSIQTNEWMNAGTHLLKWNGKDNSNRYVPEGVYYVKVEQDNKISINKVMYKNTFK